MSTIAALPSVEYPADWQCPSCGPMQPKRIIAGSLHCILCGEQCEVRPSVIAAMRHAARPDVIEPPAVPVRGAPPAKYACHNRPATTSDYYAQDGYFEALTTAESGEYTRMARFVKISHVMSEDCRYDKRPTDAMCAGCNHREEVAR